ncbi:MAG: aldehyde dehydrogenase family protein, partial [Cloacibacterium sp.]|nr:aldehyde dehydrogenase family protein [Cloacibacterium sp.]
AIRFAVPTILAGNTVILKHASICLKSGDTLQEIFEEAGFPEGVFLHFEISHSEIEEMIANPIIKGVSLTGSEAAGRKIAETAGKNLKKCVLELGGSDAFIVCEDANLVKAAESAALGRLQNCGQTCIASKRFIIHEKVFDSFLFLLLKNFKKYEIGDPNDTKINFSEMAREDLANDLEKQYQTALENGAEYILPLERISKAGFKPGILKMNGENPINDEELFGPLAMVYSGKSDEELLAIANNTLFGLGNSVWTGDKEKALFFAENLESGTVSINQITKSDVRLPFGGTKNSGYGTELSLYALHEFVSKKTIIGNL